MKNARKLTSILLLIAMLFMIAAPAMATEGEGGNQAATGTRTITITNPTAGNTYTVYKVFDAKSDDNGNISYKVMDGKTGVPDGFSVDPAGNVTYSKPEITVLSAEDITAIKQYIENDMPVATVKAIKEGPVKENEQVITNEVITITGLTDGYYYITTTTGTLVTIDSTNPNAQVIDKNDKPTIEKKVEEDSTGVYGDENDADIGQNVNFKSTIIAKAGAMKYVVHDKMSDGLDFNTGSVKVYINPKIDSVTGAVTEDSIPVTEKDSYSVETENLGDGCDFHVVFTDGFCNDYVKADDKIVITYSATLNEKAKISLEAENINETRLQYGENNFTEWDKTRTYTWKFDVFKYTEVTTGEDENKVTKEEALAGAKFTLKKDNASIGLIKVTDGTLKDPDEPDVYRVAKSEESGAITEITTNSTGKFIIQGLDADTYCLEETKAPDGYNLAAPVTVIIGAKGVVNATEEHPQGVDEVKVLNQSGTELPSTGGIGTTIFYVVGAALVVGAGVLLVTKKRMTGQR